MGEWIEHLGNCIPVKHGSMVTVRRKNGSVMGPFPYGYVNIDGEPTRPDDRYTTFIWDTCPEWAGYHVIAYRLHDDGSEAARRAERMADFQRMADDALKGDKPVKVPVRERAQ